MIGVDHPEMVVKSARITFGCHVSFLRVVDTPKEGAALFWRREVIENHPRPRDRARCPLERGAGFLRRRRAF